MVTTEAVKIGYGHWEVHCSECGVVMADINEDYAKTRARGHFYVRHVKP